MARKETSHHSKGREHKTTGGVATWKLVVMVLFVVVLGALGAYSLESRRTGGSTPKIDFGFSAASQQEIPSPVSES